MSDDDMKQDEILHMQVRLFRMACRVWKKTEIECAELFDRYKIDAYIREAYEFFHIQGDEANLEEIETYLGKRGVSL